MPPRCSPTTTPTTRIAVVCRGVARPALSGHLAGQRRQSRWHSSRFRTATTTSASSPPDELAAYPAHLHRMSPVLTLQGAVAHCDMPIESGPTMLLPLLAALRRRLHRVQPPGVHRRTSPSTTCRCRCARATRCSSTRRCITVRAPTSRPTSAGWPICCRSRRRSAGRWRRWTAPRWCGRSIRRCSR